MSSDLRPSSALIRLRRAVVRCALSLVAPLGGGLLRVVVYCAVLLLVALTVFLRSRFPGSGPAEPPSPPKIDANSEFARSLRATFPTPRFRAVQRESGVDFQYSNGATGEKLIIEQTGGGAGWFDYDGDGQCDLYLVQGGDPTAVDRTGQPRNQLFQNVGNGQFRDVTESTGAGDPGYGQGVAGGDFDNDGFDDLYVTNVGPNLLYHNHGDGTFSDVTGAAGVDDGDRWSTSAAWGDLDRDGDLDLYVCNYAQFDPQQPTQCLDEDGLRIMCHPQRLDPAPDECFLNSGDGTFRAAARELGTFGPDNRALGVAIADFNNDGWSDIYVANDTTENFLFVSEEGKQFEESAMRLGCAVNEVGYAQASMGVAVGDFDHNGRLDLYVTHFSNEYDTLYRNSAEGSFHDVSVASGLNALTDETLGFGVVMQDFNLDGRSDVFVTNGHVDDLRAAPYFDPRYDTVEQPPKLYTWDIEKTTWFNCSEEAGEFFAELRIGRGVASADFDNDGDLDLCVVHQNSPVVLLENASDRGHGLKLRFIGRESNRRGIGVQVRVVQGARSFYQELVGGTSYCSSHQPVLIVGLGESSEACAVEIRWPSGITQRLDAVAVDEERVALEPAR